MRAVFSIIGAVNLYMFVFILGRVEFGDGRPILAVAYFAVAILWFLEFALHMNSIFKSKRTNRGEALKKKFTAADSAKLLAEGPENPLLEDRQLLLFLANIMVIAATVIALRFPV